MKSTFLHECGVLYIDHVAVTTTALQDTLNIYLHLNGAKLLKGPGWNSTQKVHYAFVQFGGKLVFEILAPGENSPILNHVKRGGGPYHLCYAVSDIEHAITTAQSCNAKLIVPPVPDVSFDGRRVAFLSHSLLGIFEFVEAFPSKVIPLKELSEEKIQQPIVDRTYMANVLKTYSLKDKLETIMLRCFPAISSQDIELAKMETTDGWDSLQQIRLIMEIESEFNINIPAEEIIRYTSYEEIYKFLIKTFE